MGYDKLRLMFDVKQLRVLKAVAEHGSFSAAADALSYTQPAISQQIAALEKRAGTTLVDRGSRGVRLTDAGRALVDHAEVVIARLAAAEAELEAIAGIRGGRVRLASFPTAGASLLPPALARLQRAPPRRRAELRRAASPRTRSRCCAPRSSRWRSCSSSTRLNPSRSSSASTSGIELHPLVDDPMYLALPRGHPLARKPRVRLEDVADETWIQEAGSHSACGSFHEAVVRGGGLRARRSASDRTTTTWCRA